MVPMHLAKFCVYSFSVRFLKPLVKSISCLSSILLCNTSCGMSGAWSCNIFYSCFSNRLKSRRGHCSLALTFSLSQSLLDQSDGVAEGCGASYLQYVHSPCLFVHSHLGVHSTMSILLKSVISLPWVLYCSVFIGLNLCLQLDHLVLVFPEVHLHLDWGWVGK